MTELSVPQIPLKYCSKCGEAKPSTSEYFRATRHGKHKLRADCISCERARLKEYRQRPEAKARKRELTTRPEAMEKARLRQEERRKTEGYKESTAAYYQRPEVKERLRDWNKQYRLTDSRKRYVEEYRQRPEVQDREREQRRVRKQTPTYKDYARSYQQRYIASSHGKTVFRIAGERRRARQQSLPDTFTVDEWNAALAHFHDTCVYCGCQQGLWNPMAADHFIPLVSPECLGTVAKNMVPACRSCNSSKGTRDPREWLARKVGRRKAQNIIKAITDYFDSIA